MCFLWSVVSVVAKQLRARCCFNAIEIYSIQTGVRNKVDRNKNFQGPFTERYPNEFCSRTSSYRLPHDSKVKFIRNESFLNEFIGVFIPKQNTHSGRPLVPE